MSKALVSSESDFASVGSIDPIELQIPTNKEKTNMKSNATLPTLGTGGSMADFDSDSESSLEMKKKLQKAGYGPKDFDAEASISSWHFDLGPLSGEASLPTSEKLNSALTQNCTTSFASMDDDISFLSKEEADQFREASKALATITQRAVDLSPKKQTKGKVSHVPTLPIPLLSPKKKKLDQEKQERRRKAQEEVERRRAAREARLEKARKRIARKKEEERLKEKEQKRKEQEALMSPQARRERAYSWYRRCGMPPRKDLKKRLHTVKGISEKDIDLLPWNFSHTLVNAHKMQRYTSRAKV